MTHASGKDMSVSRRDFLATAAGLTLALTVSPDPVALAADTGADAPLTLNVWLTIATDGTITIVSPAAEMGQGTFTTLPAVLGEELDADWSKVKMIYPPGWDDKKHGNPGWLQIFNTTASFATRGYFKPMRIAGAQARRVLLEAVAAKWAVPVGELSTEPSIVVHAASNRRIAYGEIAAFAKSPAELPKIEDKDLKSPQNFRFIGKDVPRVDVPLKVTGAAKYAIDVDVPGMVYAAVLQSPYEGGAPATLDDREALQVPGVMKLVRLPGGVGVVGTSVEATQAAKSKLKVTWSSAPAAQQDSERALNEFVEIARDKSRAGVPYANVGDAKAAIAAGDKDTPRRISHPLHLSCANGAAKRHRLRRPRWEIRGNLGGNADADRPAQRSRPPAANRPVQDRVPPAFTRRRLWSPRRTAGRGARRRPAR